MDFERYTPLQPLVVPVHVLTHARYPFIDVHNHQNNMSPSALKDLVKDMDKLNMAVMVNLSGDNGNRLQNKIDNVRSTSPKRFIVFANISFGGIGETGWTEKAVKQLEEDVKYGANGLKIFKNLGLSVKDNTGKRVAVDDPRLDAIWEKCGELKIPVLIHTADPKPFGTLKMNTTNAGSRSPHTPAEKEVTMILLWEVLIEEQHRMFKKHPKTTFIAAHFGWYPNNLGKLGQLLDEMPNVMVEFGAVIAELGRQPRMARQFFENTRTAFYLKRQLGA